MEAKCSGYKICTRLRLSDLLVIIFTLDQTPQKSQREFGVLYTKGGNFCL